MIVSEEAGSAILNSLPPAKATDFASGLQSSARQRSWRPCQQLRNLLRVAGGVGSDALAEAVALAAHASFRQ